MTKRCFYLPSCNMFNYGVTNSMRVVINNNYLKVTTSINSLSIDLYNVSDLYFLLDRIQDIKSDRDWEDSSIGTDPSVYTGNYITEQEVNMLCYGLLRMACKKAIKLDDEVIKQLKDIFDSKSMPLIFWRMEEKDR